MSKRYELSVSPDYVPDWGLVEGVRELFQNGLDAEQEIAENFLEWRYTEETQRLLLKSPKSTLARDTLLFGKSTKRDKAEAIGQFGEGYKLAFLALVRAGYPVTLYECPKNEIWKPNIVYSEKYGCDLLVVDISKGFVGSNEGISIIIDNITLDDVHKLQEANLHMGIRSPVHKGFFGEILESSKGKVFVNGLYVGTKENFKYGYNIRPEFLTIGRDRDLISDFNLAWVTSQMWEDSGLAGLINGMAKESEIVEDIRYVDRFTSKSSPVTKTMIADFIGNHGKIAFPVSSQSEYKMVKKNYKKLKPIIIPEVQYKIIYSSFSSVLQTAERRDPTEKKVSLRLTDIYDAVGKHLTSKQKIQFAKAIEDVKHLEE